jgi:predicted HicB family RNase H-like nuclease
MLEYKNYRGHVEYIEEARIFHGEVLGTRDVITFQGGTPDEIERAFRDSVDDYLDFCAERGEEPDKPYSGKFVVRLPETLHRDVADLAKHEHASINDVVLRAVSELIERELPHERVKKRRA